MLSQNFTLAVSARNLGVTFDNNKTFRQYISQTCRCFYHIRDFVVFAGTYLLLLPKLLQLLLLAVDLIITIPVIIMLLSRTS